MIEWMEIDSQALTHNLMKDPSRRKAAIYLPPQNCLHSPLESLPLFYIFSGWGSRSWKYLSDESAFSQPLHHLFDAAVIAKNLKPFIAVFVDGTSRLGSTQYINSPVTGLWADYFINELGPEIERRYFPSSQPLYRGLLGHSSGGFGALTLGVLHSDLFSCIGASASDSGFESLLTSLISPAIIEIELAGGLVPFLESHFQSTREGQVALSTRKVNALAALTLTATFAPNPKAGPPLFADLYFDLKTGSLIPDIFQRMLDWDPLHLIPREKERAKKLKGVHLDAGNRDDYGLHLGHRKLAMLFKEWNVPCRLSEFNGGHSGFSHRFVDRIRVLQELMST